MSGSRLNALTLMYVHRYVKLDTKTSIDVYTFQKNHINIITCPRQEPFICIIDTPR